MSMGSLAKLWEAVGGGGTGKLTAQPGAGAEVLAVYPSQFILGAGLNTLCGYPETG